MPIIRPRTGLRFALTVIATALVVTAATVTAVHPARAGTGTGTVTYTPDFATVFPNPDRGFHNRYEIINDPNVNQYVTSSSPAGSFNPDEVDRTFARAKAAGDTLIHSYVHLDMYQNSPLPQELLDNLSSGLAAIRAAGLKIVLRFAYVWASYPNASEATIEQHIAQLGPVLNANADVIDHFEAGFLGEWGEWHDSAFTDPFSQSEADARYRIIKTELDDFPPTVPIVIRYPIFNYEIQQRTTPPPGCTEPNNCMLTQAQLDRLGFHDDCFLADSADQGTYDQNSWLGWFDVPTKKQWVYDTVTSYGGEQEVGGETCDSSGDDDAAGVNAQYEMSHQHWSEINEDYAPVNINIWKAANLPASGNDPAETLFVRAQRKLGYRLRLIDSTFSTSGTPGSAYTFSAHLSNDGYAAVIQQRPVYLVFDNGTNRYNVPLPADPRRWLPGSVTITAQQVTLPANMAPGSYTLALWLPDQFQNLRTNPAYDIRLANIGTWNTTTGYNVLGTGVNIGGCTGDCTPPITPAGLTSPSQSRYSVNLSWTPSTDDTSVAGYQIMRNGTQVATVPASSTTYTDPYLSAATSYTYTVAAVDSNGNVSAASAPLTVSTAAAGDTVPPSVPGLAAASGETANSISVSWNASTDDTSVTGYRIYRNGVQVGSTTSTTFTDTGLCAATTYTDTIRAVDSAGNLSNEAVVTATTGGSGGCGGGDTTPPTVPAGLTSPSQTSSSISLSWTASTDDTSVAGYDIYRNGTKIATSTGTSYTDSGLTASTSYTYTVDAYDPAGNVSAQSSGLTVSTQAACNCTPPTVPAGLTSPGQTSTSVSLSWTASTAGSNPVTGYDVYRNGTKVGTSTGTSFTDTGLTASTSYSYTVDAYDSAGHVSAQSAALTVTTLPAGAAVYEADSSANTLAGGAVVQSCSACLDGHKVGYLGNGGTLTFNQVSAASAGTATLTVYYVDGDAGRSAVITVNGTPITVSFHGTNDNNWNYVQSLSLTVNLNAGSGNTIEFSNPSGYAPDIDHILVSATSGGVTPPSAPTGLTSPSHTSTSVSLSWNASTAGTNSVAGYDVYRNGTKVGTSTGTSFTDTGLTASTSYTYTVDAYDSAGNTSAQSASITVSTSASGGPTVYEANASVNTLAGGAVVQSCSACLDGNKVGYIGNGGTLTFNQVTKSSAGSYTMTVYYVDGDAGRSAVITVNGTPTTVSFHGTNDNNWNAVQSLTVTVSLNAGSANTIEFSNPSGYAPDIDHITV